MRGYVRKANPRAVLAKSQERTEVGIGGNDDALLLLGSIEDRRVVSGL
jgi:hypothetical protein